MRSLAGPTPRQGGIDRRQVGARQRRHLQPPHGRPAQRRWMRRPEGSAIGPRAASPFLEIPSRSNRDMWPLCSGQSRSNDIPRCASACTNSAIARRPVCAGECQTGPLWFPVAGGQNLHCRPNSKKVYESARRSRLICINATMRLSHDSLGCRRKARVAEFRKPQSVRLHSHGSSRKHLQRCGQDANPDTLCVFGLHNPKWLPHRQAHPGNPGKDTARDKLK
jgi:hypothetical protein